MLRVAPALTLALFLLPIGAGLLGTLLPALGYFPTIGGTALSLTPWRELLAVPGIGTAVTLSVASGLGATVLSLGLAVGFWSLAYQRPGLRRFDRLLGPLLATPHVAIAIGFAFLIAPSGLLARMVSPWLTGWERPPAFVAPKDAWGLTLVAGLTLKETAYLVLMIGAASATGRLRAMAAAAQALGYRPPAAFALVVFPQIYAQLRLPIYAVLAFSLSNVEVALVLAPGNPPPLAVLAARWFADYDLRLYFAAAAAAMLQLGLVLAGIALWRLAENAVAWLGRRRAASGARGGVLTPVLSVCGAGAFATGALSLASILAMGLWSFAAAWRYPHALPERWTFATWLRHADAALPIAGTSALIAAVSTGIALVLVLACLENEQRHGVRPGARLLVLLYVPLLVPQIAFLFGTQIVLVRLSLDATLFATIWAHLLFVLPYVFLSLSDPYRSLDPRYARIAAGLGASPGQVFWRVKAPMLTRPILVAAAVGFAVSIGLYLPTLFAGAGRIATLTTEAVTLSGGADRRTIGVYAILQAALPLAVYAAALGLPRITFRNRRGLA